MTLAKTIEDEMLSLKDDEKSAHLMRFFKTGKGQYGEGDKFLGITVPSTRSIVKRHRKDVRIEDVQYLIDSQWHEIRLAGFLSLIELYRRKGIGHAEAKGYVDFYIRNLNKGNNWDLVDLIAPNILGDWITKHPEERAIIFDLSEDNRSLWEQRVAIVSTFSLIRRGRFDETFQIAERYLTHKHELIHKATGWMLREAGKRGGNLELILFLESYAKSMPRTMLRYALEKFTPEERRRFMLKNY